MSSSAPTLSVSTVLLYALPACPVTAIILATFTILPAYYAKYTQCSLEIIGTVILVTRIFDAFTDPLVGYLSERIHTVYGKRKPWIAGGTVICLFSVYFLYTPPTDAGGLYLLAWLFLLYIGWTMIEIPYSAWGSQLSLDYNERTRIVTYRMVLGSIGSLLFLAAPLFPFFSTKEFSPEVLRGVAATIIVVLPAVVSLALLYVPEPSQEKTNDTVSGLVCFRSMFRNKPFWRFVMAFALLSIGAGMYNGLFYIFIDSYLGIGNQYSYVSIALFVATWVSLPLWMMIMRKTGKHKAWCYGAAFASILTPLLALIAPQSVSLFPLYILIAFIGVGWAANMIAPYSILADIVDYDELHAGSNQASNYFAVLSFLTKSFIALGSGVAFILLGLTGYQVHGQNTEFARNGFLLVMFVLPVVFNFTMVFTAWNFPLGAERIAVIRKRLDSRYARTKKVRTAQPG